MSTLKVNAIIDASGGNTATINTYSPPAPIRAWVAFTGTGTVAIRASYNVSSITDNGTGYYTVNMTNAMSDINYSITGSASTTGGAAMIFQSNSNPSSYVSLAPTTTTFTVLTGNSSAPFDSTYVNAAVFR
jgi:hypothetical protein